MRSIWERLTGSTDRMALPLAPDGPFCAIGDIHGCAELLDRLLPSLPGDMPQVFVGDYVDRGPDSAGVLRRLWEIERADPHRVVCLKGNHEAFLLDFLDGSPQGGASWLGHGGAETLGSFGVDPPSGEAVDGADWNDARAALCRAMGSELIDWLRARPAFWQSGAVAVTHAGADPTRPVDAQTESALIWGHPEFRRKARADGIWIVHGHWIMPTPQVADGRIAIDTGAYFTGRLTMVRIDTGSAEFVTVT